MGLWVKNNLKDPRYAGQLLSVLNLKKISIMDALSDIGINKI